MGIRLINQSNLVLQTTVNKMGEGGNSPGKTISRLGWMICPCNGRKTNGIFSEEDPLTKGAKVHSVTGKKAKQELIREISRDFPNRVRGSLEFSLGHDF